MSSQYTMKISRLTVDKLGVKLYDRVSAVIAELISNSYDADATTVTVRAPMGQFLATRSRGVQSDRGYRIEVEDNGVGMTPEQIQKFFLVVGAERRTDSRRGHLSPIHRRKVMGRKGVGKLAPFGICKVIEVISSGGDEVSEMIGGTPRKGFRTAHILLNYDDIVVNGDPPEDDYSPKPGCLDGNLREKKGTKITLTGFNYRRVPDMDTLERQISQRFGISAQNWGITLEDNGRKGDCPDNSRLVGQFSVQTMPNTRIDFYPDGSDDRKVVGPDTTPVSDLTPGFDHENKFYAVKGWIAYSMAPYKDDLMAGIRIYCRGKIAAQTSIFGRSAGFTGEHNVRSYLVGELHADWLDEEEDLIQTDRRDILWSDEIGAAFQNWGQRIVKRIGTLARNPLRKAAKELFFETGDVENRILNEYPSDSVVEIRKQARELAETFGRTISREEAEDPDIVENFVDLCISLAPHITLDEKMRKAVEEDDTPLSVLSGILRTARIAELSSFGKIAEERLKVIGRLDGMRRREETLEPDLQELIENAPWLIDPEWAPVTANQSLNNLRKSFEIYYHKKTGREISLSNFNDPTKRPDFVLTSQDGIVQIVEIKKPGHSLKNNEMDRIVSYHDNMRFFLDDPSNEELRRHYGDFRITLVCDEIALTGTALAAYNGYLATKLTCINWNVFLARTENVHQDFLKEMNRQRSLAVKKESDD